MGILGRFGRLAILGVLFSLTAIAVTSNSSGAEAQVRQHSTKKVKPRGILKKPNRTRGHLKTNHNRRVRFNLKSRSRGPGYSPSRTTRQRISGRKPQGKALRGILKKPSPGRRVKLGGGKKKVRFNLKARKPGPGYRDARSRRTPSKPRRVLESRRLKSARRGSKAARNAAKARRIRNTAKAAKLAKGAKYLAAGTGVGAAVGIAADLAGLDPVEMATLKATNPAEYQRRMRDLKKNPLKYMGKNVKNNTAKIGRNVKNGTRKFGQGLKKGGRKVGQGVKKVFAKRKKSKR